MARGFRDPYSAGEGHGLRSARSEATPYPALAAHGLMGTREAAAGGSPGRAQGGGGCCVSARAPGRAAAFVHLWAPKRAPWGQGATPPHGTAGFELTPPPPT